MMMNSVFSDQLGDFSALYDDVELVSVERPSEIASPLARAAADWMATGGKVETQWTQAAGEPDAARIALAPIRDEVLRAALCEEISEGVELLSDLLNCSTVGVRAATLSGPMCPRFHTDMVHCRMLITLAGPTTEWIAHDEVDFECLADRSSQDVPVRSGGHVRTLDPGAWSLLKGGRWDHEFQGVVHRSPHDEAKRLLLSFDPLFVS
ncbi:MAG: DUF1826 domain-containing protein [Pseudomonadota bacterium]